MQVYKAPIRNMQFVMHELHDSGSMPGTLARIEHTLEIGKPLRN